MQLLTVQRGPLVIRSSMLKLAEHEEKQIYNLQNFGRKFYGKKQHDKQ
jgi:hypothetical protein